MATAAATVQHPHGTAHQPRSRWTGPGWYRVLIALPLLILFGGLFVAASNGSPLKRPID